MEFVQVIRDDAVAVVTLDRPPVNALNEAFALELKAAFAECGETSVRAVVVTGEPHFAAGADIKGFQASFDAGIEERSAWTLQEAITTLERLAKPTIAAVHGYALGGGLELAMGADFRYLAHDAKVGQPEILLGIIPGAGGTQRLTRLVGPSKAKDLIFSGRFVQADEALAIGLVDRVVAPEAVYDEAVAWAKQFAGAATFALRAAKETIDRGLETDLETGLEIERQQFAALFATEDRAIGMRSFVENGPGKAEFVGR
jgi:enoyl-CoA hydratase/carnithine racemase